MEPIKKFVLAVVGILIIIVGIIGCFLPFLPGLALILLGLTVMGKQAMVLDPIKKWLEKRRKTNEKKSQDTH